MKTKEKGETEKIISTGNYAIMDYVVIAAIFSILALFIFEIASLQQQLNQANHTIAQEHSQILNLTHSLAQHKAQITNLTSILNLNESQLIFNEAISIGPSQLLSTCNTYGCYSYPAESNTTLHFNFAHAGFITINTTSQNYVYLVMEQNYSKTWFGENGTAVIGNFNYSVRSLTMPVLPGPAGLRLFYYNATAPYEAQLTITYHS